MKYRLFFAVLFGLASQTEQAVFADATKAPAANPKPPLPAISEISFEPASLTLENIRDARKVIIWGKTASGERIDISDEAKLKVDTNVVAIEPEGYIQPKAKGETTLAATLGEVHASLPVRVLSAENPPVRFVRDVIPVMSKVGCNAGTCHGSAKGKNGFKLSLRGYDPDFDYQALINDISGRRFNRVAVDQSLMLLKPTAEVPHEGRQAIKPGSREYHLLRQWIAEGTKFEDPAIARANRVEVLPATVNLNLPGMTQQVIVLAHYPDGSVRDVTRDAVLTSNNGDVAEIKNGQITAVRRGEAAILVRYEGNYGTREVTVMGDRSGFEWASVPEYNYIDKLVNTKLQRMKILPSEVCSDAEFLRRASLDLTGQQPKPEKVLSFIADSTPTREKREKLVDELLGSKGYVQTWANKWADLLQCNSENLGQKSVWLYRQWIENAIQKDEPYDKFVRQILLAQGSSYENPAANYYRVLREPGKIAEDVSQTFLGVRFNCNKCHDHPFERWTQNQYYEFAAYFAQVAFKPGPIGRNVIKDEAGGTERVYAEEVVYRNYNGGEVQQLKTGATMVPHVPFGKAHEVGSDDRRKAFVDWLTSKENPMFAKSMANRVWSYFFGIGIIDPVDDIRASNPPSNAALLDALTADFLESNFNTRHLMRTICTSRTYQLSIVPNKWNEDDKINFSHARPRRLSAEQLIDAVAVATGAKPHFAGVPVGMRSVELPDGTVPGNDFLTLFGRPKRQSACECERSSNLTLSHAMKLINGSTVGEAVSEPNNRIQQIVEKEKDNKKVVEDLYIAILNRPPSEKELKESDLTLAASRLEGAQDLAWALLNSPAFLFNR